jgi:hypothetical protein
VLANAYFGKDTADRHILEKTFPFFGDNRMAEHIIHVFYQDDIEAFSNPRRYIVQVTLVVLRDQHAGNVASLCGQQFFGQPPMGRTRPRKVISPVMASCLRTGFWTRADTIEVAMVIPAEGPSFGIAPSGTWT